MVSNPDPLLFIVYRMKYPKKNNMLKYVLVVLGVVLVFLVVRKINEGFQTGTTVNLYFGVDNPLKGPNFISSSDPRVTYVSSSIGTATIKIDSSLGPLKGFSGQGWSQAAKWIPLTGTRLDYANNALHITQPFGSGMRILHNSNYTRPMLSSTVEMKLPQAVTQITLNELDTATFALGTNAGDPANKGAKIWITLNF